MDRLFVRDIMASPAVTAGPEVTAIEAARLMREKGIGALVVCEGKRPVGILTERDLAWKVVCEGLDPGKLRAADLMSSPVLSVPPGMDALEAARTMARHRVRRLPVVQGQQLVGIVTERDLLEVSPDLVEVDHALGEPAQAEAAEAVNPDTAFLVKCDACSALTDGKRTADGLVYCEDCWTELRTHAY